METFSLQQVGGATGAVWTGRKAVQVIICHDDTLIEILKYMYILYT